MSRAFRFLSAAAFLAAEVLGAQPPANPAGSAGPHWPRLDGGGAYVLFLSTGVTVVNGSPRELARARGRRANPAEELFWFEREGKEHAIRNAATLAPIKALFARLLQLGQQQAVLLARQGEVSREQTMLETQQTQLMGQQEALGERLASLAAEQAQLQQQGEDTSSVEAEMQGLEEEGVQFEQPQIEIAKRREELFLQMQGMTRQLADLDRQQEQATADAERQLRDLVSRALADGTAKALKQP